LIRYGLCSVSLPLFSIFCGVFLFDGYGDSQGREAASWFVLMIPSVMILFCIGILILPDWIEHLKSTEKMIKSSRIVAVHPSEELHAILPIDPTSNTNTNTNTNSKENEADSIANTNTAITITRLSHVSNTKRRGHSISLVEDETARMGVIAFRSYVTDEELMTQLEKEEGYEEIASEMIGFFAQVVIAVAP